VGYAVSQSSDGDSEKKLASKAYKKSLSLQK